jgi:hypothetical protein
MSAAVIAIMTRRARRDDYVRGKKMDASVWSPLRAGIGGRRGGREPMLATGNAHRHHDTSEKLNAALAEYNR